MTSAQRAIHERISVNNICFPRTGIAVDVERWRSLGASQIGLTVPKLQAEGWDEPIAMLRDAGFQIATLVHPFIVPGSIDDESLIEPARKTLLRTLEAAETLGARTVYLTTGARGKLDWEEAAEAFAVAIAPCKEQAREAAIEILTEPAPALYADMHIAHSLHDTVALAEIAGIGVVIDIFSCWTERGLKQTIERAAPRCHLVQVSDYVLGDRALSCRAVPGDGAIPLERIIGWILETGYSGAFDLELIGPRIDAEGHYEAVRRTCDVLGDMLVRLGA